MNTSIKLTILIFLAICVSSCLTIEKKEYTFEVNADGSGSLRIKFINILSMKDDTANVTKSDFQELVTNYIEGNQMQQDYPDATVRSKRLFEENGVLCGEVILDFKTFRSVGIYQYDLNCPYMFNVNSFLDSEAFVSSNGDYGGDIMPVVFWPKTLTRLKLTTSVTNPDETTLSLVDEYRSWKMRE